jgi:flagellar biosynthesis/type III secretory pathway protein FliH
MLEDILEESWTYQEISRKGMQKGLEKGLEQGLEQGREEERQKWVLEKQETLISFVQVRFPELVSLAKQQTASIKDPEELHNLIIKLFSMQTADEARNALMEVEKQ